MHPAIQAHYTSLFRRFPPPGADVLEIGAHPASSAEFIRDLPGCRFVGLNLELEGTYAWGRIARGNANAMDFPDDSFDAVISNAMLEHDARFWLTLAEVRRVLKVGGLFYVGAPGFRNSRSARTKRVLRVEERLQRSRWSYARRVGTSAPLDALLATAVYPFHSGPGDYYRFSETAMRDVILQGFEVLDLEAIHLPPRIVAVGRHRPAQ